MKLEIVKTFSNNYLLTYADVPIISLHNEFNNPAFAQFLHNIIYENYHRYSNNDICNDDEENNIDESMWN